MKKKLEQTTQWPKEQGQKDKQRSTKHTYKSKIWNNIGLLHEYWWILSGAVYHIAWACECNMLHCEGQYSSIFMQ